MVLDKSTALKINYSQEWLNGFSINGSKALTVELSNKASIQKLETGRRLKYNETIKHAECDIIYTSSFELLSNSSEAI